MEHHHVVRAATCERADPAGILGRIVAVLGDQDVVAVLVQFVCQRRHEARGRVVPDALDPNADQVCLSRSEAPPDGILLVVELGGNRADALALLLRDAIRAAECA